MSSPANATPTAPSSAPSSAPAPVSAPAAPASQPSAQPATLNDAIRAAFAEPPKADTPVSSPSPSPEPASTTSPAVSPEQPPAAGEQPATSDATLTPAVAAGTPADDEPIEPDSKSQDGKTWYFREARGRQLMADRDTLRGMRQVVPDLTADSFKGIVEQANAASLMASTYKLVGDKNTPVPEQIQHMDDILGYFKDESPVAFGVMAIRLAQKLPEANPQAYATLSDFFVKQALNNPQRSAELNNLFVNRTLQQAREGIQRVTDPKLQAEEIAFVQNLEYRYTGKYTPAADLKAGKFTQPVSQPPQSDPREADLARREQALRDQQTENQRQETAARDNYLNSQAESAVWEPINAVLADFKSKFGPNPSDVDKMTFENAANILRSKIREFASAHPEWNAQHLSLLAQAQTGNPDAIQRYTNYHRWIAQQAVRANAPTVLGMFNRPNQQPAVPSSPRSELAPSGVGTPAAPNGVDQILKADNWKDVFAAAGLTQ